MTARRIILFTYLLALSLRFHLERQTGGVSRDIERGSRSIQSLLNYTIYNILPTLVEITMVIVLLSAKFDGWFAAITFGALVLYIGFTVSVTEWRTAFRRAMNEQDSKANTKALDALLNYVTAIGYGVDRLLNTEVLLPVGVVVGFVTSFYIVYVKTQEQPQTSMGDSRPAATRNDTGDDAPS